MRDRYIQAVGSGAAAGKPSTTRTWHRPALIGHLDWGRRSPNRELLRRLDTRLLVVVGLALAAAGGAREQESILEGGRFVAAITLRASVVLAMVLCGVAIQLSPERRRIGRLLLVAAILPCASLLNATHHFVGFSIGVPALALTPAVLSILMLALPAGRIDSPLERRFAGAGLGVLLLLGLLTWVAPAHTALGWLLVGATALVTGGTAALIIRRAGRVSSRVRRLLVPLAALAVVYATVTVVCMIANQLSLGETARDGLEIANMATALAIPVAIALGLAAERMSLGRVLAGFVSNLGREPASDVQGAMASTLKDPTLGIYYRREETDEFLDADGRRRLPALSRLRRQTMITGPGGRAAVIDYDADLSGQEDYLRAAGKTALLWFERERLAADLQSQAAKLDASRRGLSRAAAEERQRLGRDLHDGAQQHLIGMHIKLELAMESLQAEPERSAGLLVEVGREMSETADDLRSLATRAFPPTLREYGLVEALASAIRTMGLAVHVEASAIERYAPEIETQVYFACVEALQNVAKHCGQGATATLQIWAAPRRLCFELRDSGPGFDRGTVIPGLGLGSMSDRLSSVGGWLSVAARPGHGTVVTGEVPASLANAPLR